MNTVVPENKQGHDNSRLLGATRNMQKKQEYAAVIASFRSHCPVLCTDFQIKMKL